MLNRKRSRNSKIRLFSWNKRLLEKTHNWSDSIIHTVWAILEHGISDARESNVFKVMSKRFDEQLIPDASNQSFRLKSFPCRFLEMILFSHQTWTRTPGAFFRNFPKFFKNGITRGFKVILKYRITDCRITISLIISLPSLPETFFLLLNVAHLITTTC